MNTNTKIVVIGGSGLIGTKLVRILRQRGYEAVPASPSLGVNAVTGEGLAEALRGASVVIDVSNPTSFEDTVAMDYFETSTRNLLAQEAAAGVQHHVALSVVGLERLPEYGYFRAKIVQEKLIAGSPIPYSIIRATQFFEFIGRIADEATHGQSVRVSSALIQPMAADDVAKMVAEIAVGMPTNNTIEIAGPDQLHLDELIRLELTARHDPRDIISDPRARYFGGELSERTLVPECGARLSETRFKNWLAQSTRATSPENPRTSTVANRGERPLVSSKKLSVLTLLVTGMVLVASTLVAHETITPLTTHDLEGVPGKEVLMYLVDFPPGHASPIHRHHAQVSVYVLEGSVVMQVKGGQEVTLKPGQTFYESRNDIHAVSRNASNSQPAKFLVSMVKDKGAPLVELEK